MANALRRKEKLLKEHDAIDKRKRQEAEREKLAKREKIKEVDLVISMVTQYQDSPPPKRTKPGAYDNSKAEFVDVEPLLPGPSKVRVHRNLGSWKASGRRVGPADKSEPVLETPLLSTGKRIAPADQATCTPNRGVSGHADVEAMIVSRSHASVGIAEPESGQRSYERSGSLMSQAGGSDRAPAEHRAANVEPGTRVTGGDCSPSRNGMQHPNRDCFEEKQIQVNWKTESNIPSDSQRLRKRKRELEEALEKLVGLDEGGQLHWTAERDAEVERLDQELHAISNELDVYSS